MTTEEKARIAKGLARGEILFDSVSWDEASHDDLEDMIELFIYERETINGRREQRNQAQRRARALLKSLLTPAQLAELKRRQYVTVVGSKGGVYRLHPRMGRVEGVDKHGSRWFARRGYCFHFADPNSQLPKADICVGQLLLLSCDEDEFLSKANVKENTSMLWDGAWLKRLYAARRSRTQIGFTEPGENEVSPCS